jgi:hypothetical protein
MEAAGSSSKMFAMPGLRLYGVNLSPWRSGFKPGPVHVEFVVDKVIRLVFLRFLQFFMSLSFHE